MSSCKARWDVKTLPPPVTDEKNKIKGNSLVPADMSITGICRALRERGIDPGDIRSLLIKTLEKVIGDETKMTNINNSFEVNLMHNDIALEG